MKFVPICSKTNNKLCRRVFELRSQALKLQAPPLCHARVFNLEGVLSVCFCDTAAHHLYWQAPYIGRKGKGNF
jgi:hypothetical protein